MVAIWKDVEDTRRQADEWAAKLAETLADPNATEDDGLRAAFAAFEALRLELRAASQTVSHALTMHAEELREISRAR